MSETAVAPSRAQTPFQALGGEAGVRRLGDAFYDAMDQDPAAAEVRAMHAADLSPMRERLTDWLVGWTGGPPVYGQRNPGRPCIVSAHATFAIGVREADQWMACMRRALAAVEAPTEWRGPLERAFERMCQGLRTS